MVRAFIVDIDDTLCKYEEASYREIEERYKPRYPEKPEPDYYPWSELLHQQLFVDGVITNEWYASLDPIPGCKDGMEKLRGYIALFSGRESVFLEGTVDWLIRNRIRYGSLHLNKFQYYFLPPEKDVPRLWDILKNQWKAMIVRQYVDENWSCIVIDNDKSVKEVIPPTVDFIHFEGDWVQVLAQVDHIIK